jgi:hypothetical protein
VSRFRLVLCLAGLVPAAAVAQTPAVQDQLQKDLEAVRHTQRTEDIEVLRRILNRSLGMPDKVAVQPRNQPLTTILPGSMNPNQLPAGPLNQLYPTMDPYIRPLNTSPQAFDYFSNLPRTTAAYGPFDGVYLTGQGIVYTLHIPENVALVLDPPARSVGLADTCRKCHEVISKGVLDGAATAETPLSEWDRVRRELLGQPATEKPSGPAKLTREQICEPGNLAELILGALARNARNVRHLPAEEKIIVVVTFDGLGGSARDRWTYDRYSQANVPSTLRPPSDARGVPDRPGLSVEESQQLTLGDLHLKQAKPKDAVAAYERGLTRFKDPVVRIARPKGMTPVQQGEMAAELQKGIRDAYARLAQARITAGDIDRAQNAIEMARNFKVELMAGTTAPAKGTEIPVPAKLIVSIGKGDLDRAGDDTAAIKTAAKVETTGFPPADRKK